MKNIYRLTNLAIGFCILSVTCSATDALAAATEQVAQPNKRLAPGDMATDFTVIDPEGKEVRLSDFRGRVVVLDFWATWCAPCLRAMPEMSKLAQTRAADGLTVLAICVADTPENYSAWVNENAAKYSFQTGLDPLGKALRESVFSSAYGVSMLPAVWVVDREGRLVGRAVTYPKEKANIDELLAKAGLGDSKALSSEVAADAVESPKPGFRETLGKLKAGDSMKPVVVENPDGTVVPLESLAGDGPMVLTVFTTKRINEESIDFLNTWALRYSGQGLRMVGLAAYGSRDEYDEWLSAMGERLKFPVVFDPVGPSPAPNKPKDEMSDEEIATYNALVREHYSKVAPMVLAGGLMAPVPHTIVIDKEYKFLGIYIGSGPKSRESLSNLLLRAGLELEETDRPAHIFTAEETAPTPPEKPVAQLQPGQIAPNFGVLDIDGKEIRLSDYRGKVVVLDFWATWCGPCLKAMPHTQSVAATYKDQGVVVLGSCTRDRRSAFEKWVRANGPTYPDIVWGHDPAERKPERASRALYGVSGIPTQFVIDRDGRIVDVIVGYFSGEVLLDAALSKAGIQVPNEILIQAEEDKRQRRRLQ